MIFFLTAIMKRVLGENVQSCIQTFGYQSFHEEHPGFFQSQSAVPVTFFIRSGHSTSICYMVTTSVMYCHWMVSSCSDAAVTSSTSCIHCITRFSYILYYKYCKS